MRDGVSLNTLTKIEPLVIPSQITNLPLFSCYVKLSGNYPVTRIAMDLAQNDTIANAFEAGENV